MNEFLLREGLLGFILLWRNKGDIIRINFNFSGYYGSDMSYGVFRLILRLIFWRYLKFGLIGFLRFCKIYFW